MSSKLARGVSYLIELPEIVHDWLSRRVFVRLISLNLEQVDGSAKRDHWSV